jgi:hypothetical protein
MNPLAQNARIAHAENPRQKPKNPSLAHMVLEQEIIPSSGMYECLG